MNPDDPKLTAYALDELDPAERAEIEQLLRENPAVLAEVEETRSFTARLGRELKADAGAPLTAEQRSALLAMREGQPVAELLEPAGGRWSRLWLPLAAAVCIVAGVASVMLGHLSFLQKGSAERAMNFAAMPAEASNDFTLTPPLPEVALLTRADVKPQPTPSPMTAGGMLAGGAGGTSAQAPADHHWSMREGRLALAEAPALAPAAPAAAKPVEVALQTRFALGKDLREIEKVEVAAKDASAADPDGFGILRTPRGFDTESYDAITDNAFLAVRENPLSTFSIDVDTASYANVRRFLTAQSRPPKGAVRIEELLNYFTYDYPQPEGDAPFSATMEVATCPWAPEHRLVRVGLKGREIREEQRPASNLVFLIDVSGSMQPANKLPLLKKSLALLVDRLSAEDTVSIAVYAGASGTVLEPTHSKRDIRAALDRLESGGSTNGAAGIQLAYRLAEQSFIKGGVNRVILATDGDFNVGMTSQSELVDLIERKAKSGVFLTVLGFGMDNLKDSTLEKLADKGNGNYAYIDTLNEGRKVLVEQMNGTLVTIAKDVKIQVEFNPAQAAAYRLIGYENRLLAKEDFNDDRKDAGEIGAGHTVTALYEIVPAGKSVPGVPAVDALKYQESGVRSQESAGVVAKPETKNQKPETMAELLTLKLRYKAPDGDTSKLLEFPLTDRGETWEKSSRDFRFAAAVAGFGMLLRDSTHKGSATWDSVRELAVEGQGEDRSGYRAEFVTLIDRAKAIVH